MSEKHDPHERLGIPDVFDIIDTLPPSAGKEIQLTDAEAKMARVRA